MNAARFLAVAALAAITSGCATALPPHPPMPIAARPVGEAEAPPSENLMRWTGRARSFPDSVVIPTRRLDAFEYLQKWRLQIHIPYVPPFEFHPLLGTGGGPLGTEPCQWHTIGPTNVNGRVTGIAVDPTNADKILLTTVGGVWRTQDGTRTWERVSDLNDMMAGVYSSVAMNASNPSEVFVAGGDANLQMAWRGGGPGLWRSPSGGAASTWEHLDTTIQGEGTLTLDRRLIFKIQVATKSPYNIYVASDTGVFVGSRVAGAPNAITWRRVGTEQWPCSDIALDESHSNPVIYAGIYRRLVYYPNDAAADRGIWQYDFGAPSPSWKKVYDVAPNDAGGIVSLAASKGNKPPIYAMIEDARSRDNTSWSSGDLFGIFRINLSGSVSFERVGNWDQAAEGAGPDMAGGYRYFNSALMTDPDDPDVLYAGGIYLHRAKVPGDWLEISAWMKGTERYFTHRDQHCMAIAPSTGSSRWLYVGNDGGLDRMEIPVASAAFPAEDSRRWWECDHGLNVTEYYDIVTQGVPPMSVFGGTQDNGAPATFGNMTWLDIAQCDAGRVSVDAPIGSTIYEGCVNGGGTVLGVAHPVPQSKMTALTFNWKIERPTCLRPGPPVVADPRNLGLGLAAMAIDSDQPAPARLLKLTTGGTCWTEANATLSGAQQIESVAIGKVYPDSVYYVGYASRNEEGDVTAEKIWYSKDGGLNWRKDATGLPSDKLPARIVPDRKKAERSFACYGGKSGGDVYLTTNGGTDWKRLLPSGLVLPPTSILDLAISPDDPNKIYGATEIGVVVGTVNEAATPPTVHWDTFDEGLPNGVDVTTIDVNDQTKTLLIGTLGYGAYERRIGAGVECPQVLTMARDNVFDRGDEPSPNKKPNPEDPIEDTDRSTNGITFYKHNDDDPTGQLHWYSSNDVRVSVPGHGSEADTWNGQVDPVSVELCPITADFCPPGTIPDERPIPDQQAYVYVQVHNRGTHTAHNVRVMAIWSDATLGIPLLPANFWSMTFPANATACGGWTGGINWHLFDLADSDCNSSFQNLSELGPDASAVVTFNWEKVPLTLGQHCCVLVIVESDEDPLPTSIRNTPVLKYSDLVPGHHQIAQRNIHVADASLLNTSKLMTCSFTNNTGGPIPLNLFMSRRKLPFGTQVELVMPSATTDSVVTGGFAEVNSNLSAKDRATASDLGLDGMKSLRLVMPQGKLRGSVVPADSTIHLGIILRAPAGVVKPGRFEVLAVRDSTVLGGNTYVITPRP
jgi:photosystem II stability/assembly factor-like uncharacterized protein